MEEPLPCLVWIHSCAPPLPWQATIWTRATEEASPPNELTWIFELIDIYSTKSTNKSIIADLSAIVLAPHLVPPREREELGGGDEAVARVRTQLVAVLLVVLRGGRPKMMIP